jgi:hypothetical protein
MADLMFTPEEEALFEKLVKKGYTLRYIRGVIDLEGISDIPIVRKMIHILKGERHE